MRNAPSSDIIEVIDDDLDVFGDGASNHAVEDTGGRRVAGPVAAALLLAMIGYGVATSATDRDSPVAVPVTSSTIAVPVTPKPAAAIPDASVPFYAAEPPREFSVKYANVQELDHAPYLGYAHQLWATDGASATSGSWFSVTTYRAASRINATNAYRVEAGGSSIAISRTPGGQSITQFTAGDRFGVSITSYGWEDDDLIRLAASVGTDGRTVSFADSWFTSDHQMLTSVQPWLAVQSIPAEQVSYVSTADPGVEVVITAGKRLQAFEGGAEAERDIALRFLLDRNTEFEVGGILAVAGTIVGQRSDAMATWIDDGNVVTATAPLPLRELIAIASTVHRVTDAEWEGMKFQALTNTDRHATIASTQTPAVFSGVDADDRAWQVEATMSSVDNRPLITWRWEGNGFVSDADATAQINTVVDHERTYVLADLPSTIAVGARLEVTRSGFDPVVVLFSDAGSGTDRTFAAFAFSEAVPYTAQIIDKDGLSLAEWSSTHGRGFAAA